MGEHRILIYLIFQGEMLSGRAQTSDSSLKVNSLPLKYKYIDFPSAALIWVSTQFKHEFTL